MVLLLYQGLTSIAQKYDVWVGPLLRVSEDSNPSVTQTECNSESSMEKQTERPPPPHAQSCWQKSGSCVYKIKVSIYFLAVNQMLLLAFRCYLHPWPDGHFHLKVNNRTSNHSRASKSLTSSSATSHFIWKGSVVQLSSPGQSLCLEVHWFGAPITSEKSLQSTAYISVDCITGRRYICTRGQEFRGTMSAFCLQ